MRGSALRRKLYRFFANAVLLLPLFPVSAGAWGRIGHRVAAKIAEERLTPRARAAVDGLLGPGVKIADVATWADEQQEIRGSAQWHSVNVPLGESRYNSRYCLPRGCVVGKIEGLKRVLSGTAGKQEKAQALKFLIHLIADIHQPLHVGDNGDKGGNLLQVRFFREGSNLHRAWDFEIMEFHTKNEQVWLWDLTFLANPRKVAEWSKGTPEDWATESLQAAKTAYRMPGTGSLIKSGARLDAKYCREALPVIRRQLAKAGIRLSWVLNELFGKSPP